MNIILFVPELPVYHKRDIDMGETPPVIYEIIEACRGAFFFSHGMRKEVNFAITCEASELVVIYEGSRLRYLGPEERGQTLLLEKALAIGRSIPPGNIEESTPGLSVCYGPSEEKLAELAQPPILFFSPNSSVASPQEICSAHTCVLNINAELPDWWQIRQGESDRMTRTFPKPYDTASTGTKLIYLHYVRDQA
jgi:hypothetical protein